MSLLDIVGDVCEAALDWLPDGFLSWLVRKPGYLICRIFSRDADQESGIALIMGLLFWAGVIALVFFRLSR